MLTLPFIVRPNILTGWIATTVSLLLSIAALGENLLANPGFDSLQLNGIPHGWSLFIMPGNEAFGDTDRIAHDGDYSVMLATLSPYAREPVNNWSQPIFDDLTDTTLTITASIRTENAGNAGLWIQCFRRGQSQTLSEATTIQTTPLSGTHGWSKVSTSIDPPADTDFVMVRCILLGTGKAWFDSLEALAAPTQSEQDAIAEQWEELTPITPEAQAPSKAPIQSEDILYVSAAIQATIRNLEQSNAELIERIASIQENLDTYRDELQTLAHEEMVHPLIPYDHTQDEAL
ncbi:MAG: hypothetical protein VCD00_05000 [Candidatus Hydrogenedentota bacterium]